MSRFVLPRRWYVKNDTVLLGYRKSAERVDDWETVDLIDEEIYKRQYCPF